jgi:uncharacterized 2Fe-2S/4Fe-4S cluster protein (DUF4445 family)
MYTITVRTRETRLIGNIPPGEILSEVLRNAGYNLYTPCGGMGICGKCRVYIAGRGYVTSCLFPVNGNLEVVLPDPAEARILVTQYRHTRQLPYDPGPSAMLSDRPFGVAVDIGTTSMVFHFADLSSGALVETRTILNPQARYGADVISRINYCVVNPGGVKTLQKELITSINSEMAEFTRSSEVSRHDLVKLCFAGNTTMLHILLGIDPGPIAFAPFTPAFTGEKILQACDLDLESHPGGEVKILPSFSAYTGSDIVGGIASIAPSGEHTNFLFLDLGTNGEMALVTPQHIYCCAAAAGPAFEGANIEHGIGAVEGAIMSYEGPGHYTTIGDYRPTGICGSGLVDLVAFLLKAGYIKSDGYMADNFTIATAEESGTGQEIYLTPKDVREIQLAKSAVASGINILLSHAGLSPACIDALFLAGGFGNYVRPEKAAAIGLFPPELSTRAISAGNTSGTGALLALRSVFFDRILTDIHSRMINLELSEHPDFVMHFAMNMEFLDYPS